MDDIEEGWEVYYDNGEPYFFNSSTGETTWDKPTRKKKEAVDPPPQPTKDSGAPTAMGGLLAQIKQGKQLKKVGPLDTSASLPSRPKDISSQLNAMFAGIPKSVHSPEATDVHKESEKKRQAISDPKPISIEVSGHVNVSASASASTSTAVATGSAGADPVKPPRRASTVAPTVEQRISCSMVR